MSPVALTGSIAIQPQVSQGALHLKLATRPDAGLICINSLETAGRGGAGLDDGLARRFDADDSGWRQRVLTKSERSRGSCHLTFGLHDRESA
jgi:hypothetical protein